MDKRQAIEVCLYGHRRAVARSMTLFDNVWVGGATGRYSRAVTEDWRIGRIEEIRSLIKQAVPDVVEEIKWRKPSNPDGVPAFSLDGLICTLEMYKGKVKVNFAKGSSISDPDNLFNASLQAPVGRSIDLREDDALDPDAFNALIRDAVRVNRKRAT